MRWGEFFRNNGNREDDRRVNGAGHRAERFVLVAQPLLRRLRSLLAGVPDLVGKRELLRA